MIYRLIAFESLAKRDEKCPSEVQAMDSPVAVTAGVPVVVADLETEEVNFSSE